MKPASVILTIILVLLVIGGIVLYSRNGQVPVPGTNNNNGSNGQVFCTQDAMLCSDGSYVGRVPPSCNFAACPVGTATTTRTSVTAGFNQTITKNGLSITPLAVVEDSRCPVDVTCIQAGRVRVNTRLSAQSSINQILILNTPFSYGTTTITLSGVQPEPRSTTSIATSSYRFTFTFEEKK